MYKNCPVTAGQLLVNTENNTELLMTRVKGISQKVDTMHLHEDQTDSNQLDSLDSYENGNKPSAVSNTVTVTTTKTTTTPTPRSRVLTSSKDGAITPPTSASDNDNDVTETEEDSTASNLNSTFIVSRRRKSPSIQQQQQQRLETTTNTTTTTTTNASLASLGIKVGQSPLGAGFFSIRRTPPINNNEPSLIGNNSITTSSAAAATSQTTALGGSGGGAPLYSEKKLKKPSVYEPAAAIQRPTIASTVKMVQAAIEKKNAQTQGDKLNQIKAMRRQHNSRSGGATV